MGFIKEVQAGSSESKYKKLKYIQLFDGTTSSIRILDEEAYETWYHYVNRAYIKCLGRDTCPICKVNSEIFMSNPDDFRDHPDYISGSKRYYVNVLDKTDAKHCEKCGHFEKNTSLVICSKCQTSIANSDIEPINEVRILSKGPTLFKQLDALSKTVVGEDGELLGINGFGIKLRVEGTGKETITTAISNTFDIGEVVIPEGQELFDLKEAIITLTPSEIIDFKGGVSLRDVFLARGSQKSEERTASLTGKVEAVVGGPSSGALDIVAEKIDELFGIE